MAEHIEFDWASSELENHLRPYLERARKKFFAEYIATYARWTRSIAVGAASDGQSQICELKQICTSRLSELFAEGPRRIFLQLLRSIPLAVIDHIAHFDSLGKSANLVHVTTLALVQKDEIETDGANSTDNRAFVSAEWLENFRSVLPEHVGSVLAVAFLLDFSRGWYRIAGKGGLMSPVEAIEESAVSAAEERLRNLGSNELMILPSVTFVNNAQLRPYLDRYDELQNTRGAERYTGFLGVVRDPAVVIRNYADALWNVGICRRVVEIKYPIHNRTLISNNYLYGAIPIQPWFERLGYYADWFEARLGVSFEVFRHCCVGVSRCFVEQAGIVRLKELSPPAGTNSGSLVLVHKLDNAAQEEHVSGFLYSVICRGMLRAPLQAWIRELGQELEAAGISDAQTHVAHFIKTFTRRRDVDDTFLPAIFIQSDATTLAYDMISANEFFGFCLRKLTRQDDMPDLSIRRGLFFEKDCWDRLQALKVQQAVKPGYTYVDETGKQGEIDIAFFAGEALVILECKSWQKSIGYFRGEGNSVQQRLAKLVEIYQSQCRRNAEHLLSKLRFDDPSRIISIIAVVEPEYIGPDNSELWFGQPEKMMSRVLTPDEIVDLCSNAIQLATICQQQERL